MYICICIQGCPRKIFHPGFWGLKIKFWKNALTSPWLGLWGVPHKNRASYSPVSVSWWSHWKIFRTKVVGNLYTIIFLKEFKTWFETIFHSLYNYICLIKKADDLNFFDLIWKKVHFYIENVKSKISKK